MRNSLIILAIVSLILGCSEDSEVSKTPEISFVSVNPSSIISSQESVIVRISYFDGDGDLGENDANVKNLFLTDSRNDVRISFRIPMLAPAGESIAIQGELPIEISNVALIGDGSSDETIQYSIHLVDRAGNESNVVETTPIVVSAQ